jgi:hypothetical protein
MKKVLSEIKAWVKNVFFFLNKTKFGQIRVFYRKARSRQNGGTPIRYLFFLLSE